MLQEEWKPIPNYPNYEVSNMGRIKRLGFYHKTPTGQIFYTPDNIQNGSQDGGGYTMCGIKNEHGAKRPKIHRIVAKVFLPNPENKPEVNHINMIRTDNRVANLEWCDRVGNMRHRLKMGGYVNNTKLTEEDVDFIRKCIDKGGRGTQEELALKFNVHQSTINKIYKKTRRLINI
jgi:hypothetical protein